MADALQRAVDQYRRQLELREREAFRRITATYTESYRNLQVALDRLHNRIEQAVATGERISPAWLYQQERYVELQAALGRELQRAATVTRDVVEGEAAAAVELAQQHAEGLVRTSLGPPPVGAQGLFGSFARLNPGAVQTILGFVHGPGSPVGKLLSTLAPHGQQQIGQALADGIVRGLGPRETARTLSTMMGGQSARALTIARTETMRAYRESTRQSYRANKRLVMRWEWVSALDRRTCAACYSMHGQTFPTEQKLDGHPNCRCVMVPLTPTWKQLGNDLGVDLSEVPETRVVVPKGADVFAQLPEADQLAILGRQKLGLYRDGRIELRDLVTRTRSTRWGTMRREATVKEALAHAETRGARRVAKTAKTAAPAQQYSSVADHFDRARTSNARLRAAVDDAFAAVDRVVQLPKAPRMLGGSIPQTYKRTSSRGWIRHTPKGRITELNVSPSGGQPGLTTVHELGHVLDYGDLIAPLGETLDGAYSAVATSNTAIGSVGGSPELQAALTEWRDAVRASEGYNRLRDAERCKLRSYLLRLDEAWARSFAQYVAKHGGSDLMRAELEREQALYRMQGLDPLSSARQWLDDDFAPIDRAITHVLQAAGLIP